MEWSVGNITKKRAFLTPDKPAIIFEGVTVSYQEINQGVNRVAHYLQRSGLKKGDRIAVDFLNCLEFIYFYFSAAKLGDVCLRYLLSLTFFACKGEKDRPIKRDDDE